MCQRKHGPAPQHHDLHHAHLQRSLRPSLVSAGPAPFTRHDDSGARGWLRRRLGYWVPVAAGMRLVEGWLEGEPGKDALEPVGQPPSGCRRAA